MNQHVNRRAAFGGFASITALSVAPVAVAGGMSETEDATLIKLGEEIDRASAAADNAQWEALLANDRYMAMVPLPADLVAPREPALHLSRPEYGLRDGFGDLVPLNAGEQHKMIYTAYNLELSAERWPDLSGYPGKRIRELLDLARNYEAAREDALEHAGIYTSIELRTDAHREVRRLSEAISALPARTMAGAAVKAKALLAVLVMRNRESRLVPDPLVCDLAYNVTTIARDAAAT